MNCNRSLPKFESIDHLILVRSSGVTRDNLDFICMYRSLFVGFKIDILNDKSPNVVDTFIGIQMAL
jgi:hypothetical protein